jgi:predicted nucleic-acid-binding Zn-ribbon protein
MTCPKCGSANRDILSRRVEYSADKGKQTFAGTSMQEYSRCKDCGTEYEDEKQKAARFSRLEWLMDLVQTGKAREGWRNL